MTQEEKELLIKDLCARVPYKVKVQYNNEIYNIDYISALYEEVNLDNPDNYTVGLSEIKPYLRPMSSMTEEENDYSLHYGANLQYIGVRDMDEYITWLNAHHFDYHNLIDRGLALPAPEDMYSFFKKL